ncbi:MAG: zinc-ribbon domain-containing protein [Acidobacteriia bacterium]|nr:zinc-ribbon domain-containing protein [Terriglobia bacterium]
MTIKICSICGYSLEDYVTECPNCGSRSFDTGNIFNMSNRKRKKSKYEFMDAW